MGFTVSGSNYINNVKALDQGFTLLKASGASPADQADYVWANYLSLAYAYSVSISRKYGLDADASPKVFDLALDAVEPIAARIRAATFQMTGKAAFSSYVFSAVRGRYGDTFRIRTPADMARFGTPGHDAYRMAYLDGARPVEIAAMLREIHRLAPDTIQAILDALHPLIHEIGEKKFKEAGGFEDGLGSSLDFRQEESGFEVGSQYPEPPRQLGLHETIANLYHSIEMLDPRDKEIICGLGLEQRWNSIKDMELDLHMAKNSGSYYFRQARDRLKKLLERCGEDGHFT